MSLKKDSLIMLHIMRYCNIAIYFISFISFSKNNPISFNTKVILILCDIKEVIT